MYLKIFFNDIFNLYVFRFILWNVKWIGKIREDAITYRNRIFLV